MSDTERNLDCLTTPQLYYLCMYLSTQPFAAPSPWFHDNYFYGYSVSGLWSLFMNAVHLLGNTKLYLELFIYQNRYHTYLTPFIAGLYLPKNTHFHVKYSENQFRVWHPHNTRKCNCPRLPLGRGGVTTEGEICSQNHDLMDPAHKPTPSTQYLNLSSHSPKHWCSYATPLIHSHDQR